MMARLAGRLQVSVIAEGQTGVRGCSPILLRNKVSNPAYEHGLMRGAPGCAISSTEDLQSVLLNKLKHTSRNATWLRVLAIANLR